jgi:hypothetical protein
MKKLAEIVIKRLNEKGIDMAFIPSFIRDISNIDLPANPDFNDLNRKLQTLGWHEIDLDDHTFQLIAAIIDKKCFSSKREEKEKLIIKEFSIPLYFQQLQ